MGKVETSLGEVTFLASLCFLQGLFFFAASFVQLNDPDPYLWIPVYGVAGLISFLFAGGLVMVAWQEGMNKEVAKIGLTEWLMMDRVTFVHSVYCWSLGVLTLLRICLSLVHSEERWLWLDELTKEKGMAWEEIKELGGVCVTLAWLAGLRTHRFLRLGPWKGLGIALAIVILPIVGWVLVV